MFHDEYPTGPIPDMWPILAEGYVVDVNGAVHGRNGRFAEKVKARDVSGGNGAAFVIESIENRHFTVPARKCPHGHFAHYARTNCKPCAKRGSGR
jgi:hypothetical protein